MGDPDDTAEGPTERLQAGPSRPPLLPAFPARWRERAATLLALTLGGASGAGAVLWWQDEPPTPPRFRGDEHSVELILFETVAPAAENGPLLVKGALLLSGSITSTVSSIELLGKNVDVRAPRLPVTVSPSDRFQSFNLRISVRDCEMATRWTPADRPFVIAWNDGFDRSHTDRAGDFDRSIANSLIRYIDAVCDN